MEDLDLDIGSLGLQILPDSLVHAAWKEGYFDDTDLPADLEVPLQNVNIPSILFNLSDRVFKRLQSGEITGWSDLVEEGFEFKRFLFFIHCLLCKAVSAVQVEECRINGIYAARLYFSFLAIPQRGPFLIYQPNLYMKALKTLQFRCLLSTPVVQASPRKRSSRQSYDGIPISHQDLLPRQEMEALRRLSHEAEQDLIKCLHISDLGREENALLMTVDAFSKIAMQQEVQDTSILSHGFTEHSIYNPRRLSLNSFCGLTALCTDKHGEIPETVRIIMKFVFEAMMMGFKSDSKLLSPSHVTNIRDIFIQFTCWICKSVGDTAQGGVCILIQHLCLSAPDRADSRTKLVGSVANLISMLPLPFFKKACSTVIVLTCHEKASVRLFSIEVLGRISILLKVLNNINDRPDETDYNPHKLVFAAVLARIQDSSALVRSRAMSCLVLYMKESDKGAASMHLMNEIFIHPYISCDPRRAPKTNFINFNEVAKTLQNGDCMTVAKIPLPCAQTIVDELCEFCDDDKVYVRRSALQLLLRILYINEKFMTKDLLVELGSHCGDEAILVRKMMVQEFTSLLLVYPTHQSLIRQWTMDVVPLIFDSEVSVVENVLETFRKTILDNMVMEIRRPQHHLPWLLMSQISNLQLNAAFIKACSLWQKETLRSYNLFPILKSHIGIDKPYNDSAWVTLMCLAEFIPIKEPHFVLDFYHDKIRGVSNVHPYISQLVMEGLWLIWKQLPASDKGALALEMNVDLMSFRVPVPLISRVVDIRYGLHVGSNEGFDVNNPPDWAILLIKKCEENIFATLSSDLKNVQEGEAMKRFVITLANICLYYPRVVESRTLDQLMLMLFTPSEEEPGQCTKELKAALIVALGKFGLQNEPLAKKLIVELGTLLPTTVESDVKNNMIICLSDLCVRYTSLGDELLPDICICLKDSLLPVRQNTLKLLVQLIQEDYIKLRKNLIFHLLSMLNDTDYTIVNMTRVFFIATVLRKKSNCFTTSFVASVLHYNSHSHHSSDFTLTPQERKVFDLSGPQNRDKRHTIYRFMVSQSDNDRLCIMGYLCDMCNDVMVGKIKLEGTGEEILRDCLFVLEYSDFHISDSKDGDEDEDNLGGEEEELMNQAHKKISSEVVKQFMKDTVIPVLTKLKKKLGTLNSPLAARVLNIMKNIISNHKVPMEDIRDPQLVRELRRHNIGDPNSLSDGDSHENDHSDDEQ
ncbi:hypothetical protein ONE63_002472 [Megalurothrips usitatus]|uniref:Condensin complex subunit 1 C-terminal domain-containing protein n=1 Tax=Megalurothrips usitatus TaxID=439358 RepID=A0AAV7X917_9NEOP|nr:hypothetical protein ONE63_002472 [Megalurothrips usitatus]